MQKRVLMAVMMAAVVSMSMTGCTKISEHFSENVESDMENSEEGMISKAESKMKSFIMAVNSQNYEGISEMVAFPDNAFITDKNIEWYIARTTLADITGINIHKLNIEVKDGTLKKSVAVYINKEGYAFDMELDSNNEWRVVLPDLYAENWSLKIPKGCTVTVNNSDISSYKTPATTVDDYDTYTFPAIAKQEMKVETTSSVFGKFEQTITPVTNSESMPVICKVNDDETTSILKHVQNIWNGLYKDYTNNVGAEALMKYFTDDFDSSEITNIMTLYFPQLETGPTEKEIGQITYSNFYMKEAIPPISKDNYGCAILKSDNSVEVTFSYCIDFISQPLNYPYSVRKSSKITLAYVDAPELGEGAKTYKIKKLNDSRLFTDNDYKTNDY